MIHFLDEAGHVDFFAAPVGVVDEAAEDVFHVEEKITPLRTSEIACAAVMKPFVPISWLHDRGRYRVLERLIPKLPDVSGDLFLTLTVDPKLFGHDGEAAHAKARPKIRKILARLRKGVKWEGKTWRINAAYCTKVEFLEEFAHYHLVFRTRRYLAKGLLEKLWGLGFVHVERISNEDFHYLLKYVVKDNGPLPEWVLSLNRIRIFQASPGFYRAPVEDEDPDNDTEELERKERKGTEPTTIGERLAKWECTVIYRQGVHFSSFVLSAPFREIFEQIIFPIALEGRYLGQNVIAITEPKQLEPWLNYKKTAA